ncbi:hypothetical protein [Elizabethkingia ursingii]|uniref:Uncharacterized protein n=1 Tax=Elizabethkingia ursingii TaxID=1756150 RepID=A0ABX3NB01_9FLAO|nr:hypothetical protein [Elizabethkingia ursingii]OPB91368.1 hypothetical protein BB021_17180 [Elizabethkingia ursingii]
MKRNFFCVVFFLSIYFPCYTQVLNVDKFTGKFSSEGDITSKGVMVMDIIRKGHKIEGIANYKTLDHQLDSGVLSVNGYTKDHKAYIRFRDQKGGSVADGILSKEGEHIIFRQTTKSDIVPIKALLQKL